MCDYTTINILDMIDAIGETKLSEILSDFSCPKNKEIEKFVKTNAIDFAKRKISITFFIVDNSNGDIIAIYTLAHKSIEITNDSLTSKSMRKKIERFSTFDENSNSYTVSAFLIAQFGKNYAAERVKVFNGSLLMEKTFETLSKVQKEIGGGIVFLECERHKQLLEFYKNNRFHQFGTRYSQTEKTDYIQMVRVF